MKRCWKQRGFSLIEVVVSMLILAIGMVGSLGMIQAGQVGLEAGRHISSATGLAQAKMEEKLSIPYGELLKGPLEGEEVIDGFTCIWTIQPDTPEAHFLMIHVKVEWKDGRGKHHQLQLATLHAEGLIP